ncbi:MAG TPA: PPOX class F420-dependent oxidoreductase [Chloroflexota bacterium]|nr:PPOX class F420-dependent oxidoreductase [Chloroflexota bacterium]
MPTSKIDDKVRAFLEKPHHCVLATINRDGSPQLTVMWYDLVGDIVVMNMSRGLVKEGNLRRDPRAAICVEDGPRFVTLSGTVDIVEDRAIQEVEVNRMTVRYRGARLAATHWDTIKASDRIGIHLKVESVISKDID